MHSYTIKQRENSLSLQNEFSESLLLEAAVLRDLYLLQEDKDLSYGERKMMDTAKGLLVKELSIANEIEECKVEEKIEEIFS